MSNYAAALQPVQRLLLLLAAGICWHLLPVLSDQSAAAKAVQIGPGLLINEISAANGSTVVDPDFGAFADWIEIYNPGEETVDLGDFTLTDDIRDPLKWSIPAGTVVPGGGYMLIWADGRDSDLHSSFRLSRNGEEVALYDRDGFLVDLVRFGDQVEDVSYGRVGDGAADWGFFQQPTPGRMNDGESVTTITQAPVPQFSQAGGRYQAPLEVELSSPDAAAEIRYTLDGSRPKADSALYEAPLEIAETAVVRARAFANGLLAGPISTQTYIIGEETQLPVVSLVTEPAHLWDPEMGIYVDENIEARKDWERPATIALYEPDGSPGFQAEAAMRLFGRSAIRLPQKSLALFITEAGRGDDRLTYQLFPDQDLFQFSSFLLRSASDDWGGTMLRDGFGQAALEGHMDVGTQAFRSVLLYVNGDYFGIHNIREKQNEDYLATRYGADLDELDLLFVGYNHDDGPTDIEVLHGDAGDYEALVAFVQSQDLAAPENYASVQAQLNTDNLIDYIVAESYAGNTSWHRNRKVWRANSPHDRWDFLVYDLDRGFGRRYTNTLQDILSLDSLFVALLANDEFKTQFIQRFAHHLNTTFEPERLAALLDHLAEDLAPEIERQRAHWDVAAWWEEHYDRESRISGRQPRPELPPWEEEVAHIEQFVRDRPPALRQHLVEAFALSGTQFLTLDINEPAGGRVLVEGLPIESTPFTGAYFRDVPLRLTAVPEAGYRFVRWQGPASSREETVSLMLTGNDTMTAVFEPIAAPNPWLDLSRPRSWAAVLLLLVLGNLLLLVMRRRRR